MEYLGKEEGGVLIIPTDDLILPGVRTAMIMQNALLRGKYINEMLNNPMESYRVLLQHRSKHGRLTEIALLVEIAYPAVDAEYTTLYAMGISRINIKQVKHLAGYIYATDIEESMTGDTKDVNPSVEELREAMSEYPDQTLAEECMYIGDDSDFLDNVYYDMNANEQPKIRRYLNTANTNERAKVLKMALMTNEKSDANDDGLKTRNEDVQALIDILREKELNKRAYTEIYDALKDLCTMNKSNHEYSATYRYVKFALSMPDKSTTDNDIAEVEKTLEASHYGMKEAKERLIEYLAIKKLNPNGKGMILLLDGPPGTGKTTLAKAFAKALGRNCERISMGGCADASFIKGHGRTYTGSRAGRIAYALKSAGTNNPVIILDEVEKIMPGVHGDPDAALLEVLDPKQNDMFTDNYLGYDIDLSKVLFIATSNEAAEISDAVYDRMEYIACEGYSMDEKVKIANDYTLPEICKDLGLDRIKMSKAILNHLIRSYTREAGVRTLEKALNNILRKVAVERAKGKKMNVTKKMIEKRLGRPYTEDKPLAHDMPGIVTGLYYSTGGGGCLDIESIVVDDGEGMGEVTLTGQAGDVMIESLNLCHSHIATFAAKYGLDARDLNECNIHVHMPEGATPKDGPSAGAAFNLLFASLALNKPVKAGLCMTGEATLTGRITAIGGVDQKCAGAVRMGMTDVILPEANRRDWEELPRHIKKGANYHFVNKVEEVLEIGLDIEI